MENNYISLNRESWNQRTEVHIQSEFYDVQSFLKGKSSLKEIDLALLGDINGKSILHLQCHFGQDTLSMARMGAKATGVDFSSKAIDAAVDFNAQLGLDASFICCDLYELPAQLTGQFDIVYSSYGTIGWLPDLDKWAAVVNTFLKPGGRLILIEFHPVVWMFDEQFKTIAYSYFNTEDIVEEISGTYADPAAPVKSKTVSWNHPLTEVLGAVLSQGLTVKDFREYDYSPYNCFKNMKQTGHDQFVIEHLDHKIPMLYSIDAIKQ